MGLACTRSTGDSPGTGGTASGGSTGGTASGGKASGGSGGDASGGKASGGSTGGTASGGTGGDASGGTASGGSTGGAASGGTASGGSTGGTTGGAGDPPPPACEESTIGTSPNTLGVDVNGAKQLVHKEIFGLLMEDMGGAKNIKNGMFVGTSSTIPNTDGVRNDIIAGMKEAGVGAIEWPGGCAANGYNWETAKSTTTTLGTDGFMKFATAIGAEPVLVGRPKPEFAASNAKWVKYVNDHPEHPEWTLKYFKIGNEVWGCGGDLGHDPTKGLPTYETWYNATYDLIKEPVKNKPLFIVSATNGIFDSKMPEWITTMLKSDHLGSKTQGIEIHDYLYFPKAAAPNSIPCLGFTENQYYDIVWRANEGQIAPRIKTIREAMDKSDPDNKVKIIEDEWGNWLETWQGDTWRQAGTLMDGIAAAQTLNVFMANADRVQMAGLAQAINVIQSLFNTNQDAGGTALVKTPTFHVFKLFVPHHTNNAKWAPNTLTGEKVTGNSKTFSVVNSGATVNDAGQVHINLINVDLTKTRDVTISLTSGKSDYYVSKAEVITGPQKDSFNDYGKAETVTIQTLDAKSYQACGKKAKVTLPAKSIVMLTLNPR
jgi:alpha-N-arabinofuranosidase